LVVSIDVNISKVLDTSQEAFSRVVGFMIGSVRTIATGRLNQAAARFGDQAPMAATCCNACRTCVQTNLIALGLAAAVGAGAWVARVFGRGKRA
jgi:hypothetical protein